MVFNDKEKEVFERLNKIMQRSFNEVWMIKETYSVDLRTAAYVSALLKLSQTIKDRGLV